MDRHMDVAGQGIEATFFSNYGDRVRVEWQLMLRTPTALMSALVVPVAGLTTYWLLSNPLNLIGAWSWDVWAIVVAMLAFPPLMFLFNCYRSHRRTLAQGGITYRFDEVGFHIRTAGAWSTHTWPVIVKVRSSKGFLFIYLNKRCAFFLPMKALPGPGCATAIGQFASAGGTPRVQL